MTAEENLMLWKISAIPQDRGVSRAHECTMRSKTGGYLMFLFYIYPARC